MIISVAGIFFILPNTLTFFLMLTTYIVIQIQIRFEEEFWKTTGEQYLIYKNN
jgi:protein-S-isoprenylcysteine O-methyltransferase Ste14